MVLCANDPVGAWGGAKLLREEFGIEPTVISGPATDNQVGIDIIRRALERRGVERHDAARPSSAICCKRASVSGLGARRRAHERDGAKIPTIVLGGSGYVAGEFLRLIARASGADARRRRVVEPGRRAGREDVPASRARVTRRACSCRSTPSSSGSRTAPKWLVLSAAPHGASARAHRQAADAPARARASSSSVVDASADFRFADAAAYAAVYGHAHATPALLAEFTCAVPEHLARIDTPHAAHPGCFATTMLLRHRAARGARRRRRVLRQRRHRQHGRGPHAARHDAPSAAAEQPVRVSGAEAPARSRGARARSRPRPAATWRSSFVPHSGPFARGIHATIFVHAKERVSAGASQRGAARVLPRLARSCASTASRRR